MSRAAAEVADEVERGITALENLATRLRTTPALSGPDLFDRAVSRARDHARTAAHRATSEETTP